ncbi:hypothetical protein SAMN02787149_12134 [Pseudomonas sp. Snoq117.2]|nr:hypothetical protein SAMN02787149_12134 [Pseudomonas sp. Snoq117.2]
MTNPDAVLSEYAGYHTNDVTLLVKLDIQHLIGHANIKLPVQSRDSFSRADVDWINRIIGKSTLCFDMPFDLQEILAGFYFEGIPILLGAQNIRR